MVAATYLIITFVLRIRRARMSLTAPETVTINTPFLREIKEDNEQLRVLLAQAGRMCRQSPASGRTRLRRFASLLADVRDQLAMHFSLEEAYGYFDKPVFVVPHLSEQAFRLRAQHVALYEDVCRLTEAAENLLFCSGCINDSRQLVWDFMDFHSRLQQHEAEENELIAEAYTMNIGVADGCCSETTL
jgi:hypothetical protein